MLREIAGSASVRRARLPCEAYAGGRHRDVSARREVIILITGVIIMITWSDTSGAERRTDLHDKMLGLKQIVGACDVDRAAR
jgi:hypothetical protein